MRELWVNLSRRLADASRWCLERAVRLPGWRMFDNVFPFNEIEPGVIDLALLAKDKTLRESIVRGAFRKRTMPDIPDGPWMGVQGNAGNEAVASLDGED